MAGRTDNAQAGNFHREAAPELHVVRPCPLCSELMEFDPQSSPQVVVCDSCGLACTIDVPAIPVATLELDEFAAAPPIADDGDDVVHWLQRSPGPILPAPDFAAKQASARRRQLAMAGGVAGSAALAIALLSGYCGYHTASDELAIQRQTAASRQHESTQQLLETKQRLERERLDADAQRLAAQRDVRAVTAKYLATQSQELGTGQPWRSVAVAVDAVRSTLATDGIVIPEAHQSLRDSLYRCSTSHNLDAIELRGHAGPITALAISPDGRWLATGSLDRTARVWDLQADHPQGSSIALDAHQKPVSSVLFSHDGARLITGSRDATACLWSMGAEAPAAIPVVLPGKGQPISKMSLSADGRWLAAVSTEAGTETGLGQLWNLTAGPAGAASMALTGHAGQIQTMAVSPDSRWLALGLDDVVRLWDLTAREPAAASLERQCRHGRVTATLFTYDGKWLVTCGNGREAAVRLWNLAGADPSESLVLRGLNGPVLAATVSADSRYLAAAGDDQKLRVWSLRNIGDETEPTTLSAGDAPLTSVALSEAGDWLAASDASGKIHLWHINSSGVEPQPIVLSGSEKAIHALAFTPDGRWLAAAGDDWTARLWNLDVNQLASQAEQLAKVQIEGAPELAHRSIFLDAVDAVAPRELVESTAPGIVWSAVQRHAPKVQAGWKTWLQEKLTAPVEPHIATGPRTNEVGALEIPSADPLSETPTVASPAAPGIAQKPSLMVAMPEADPVTPLTEIKHAWPVRSIIKRPSPETEPRTAAKPLSTLEIHTR